MTYNGWKNYETWVVWSWLNNEEKIYNYIMDVMIPNILRGIGDYRTYELSQRIAEYVIDKNPLTTGMYADLLGGALREVDYYEIAEAFLNDYERED